MTSQQDKSHEVKHLLSIPSQVPHVYQKPTHSSPVERQLLTIYSALESTFGDLHWWPADTDEEMVIGAILVQNVAWKNASLAIEQLRHQEWLGFSRILEARQEELEASIHSTRFYRIKAKKLKAFATHLNHHYEGCLQTMLSQPMHHLRKELLNIYGIGKETADAIILYAARQPSFVIDAYTVRIFDRLGFSVPSTDYESFRLWFMDVLPADTRLFNQFHALLDRLGHRLCTTRNPRCEECPLQSCCMYALNQSVEFASQSPPSLF